MRGGTGLMRCLYGISLSLDKIRIKNLLSLKKVILKSQSAVTKTLCSAEKKSQSAEKT